MLDNTGMAKIAARLGYETDHIVFKKAKP